jgi:soluble cytochrome b562
LQKLFIIEDKLTTIEKQNQDIDKLIKLEKTKILQAKTKITKVREGFEVGLYDLDEAKFKVNAYLETIKKSEQEVKRTQGIAPRLTLKS